MLGDVDEAFLQHYQASVAKSVGASVTGEDTPRTPNFPLYVLQQLRTYGAPYLSQQLSKVGITDVLHVIRAYLTGTESPGIKQLPFIESLFPSQKINEDKEYLLLPGSSREHKAQGVAMCISANIAVLMEGTAATGKTALARFLARHAGQTLEIVSNSASTSIEGNSKIYSCKFVTFSIDYVGHFVIEQGGMKLVPGPLVRALVKGQWLLADELNLASPNVLALLTPVLEGHKRIYLTGYH